MIHVTVSNQITITGLTPSIKQALKQSLTIENKEFFKFQKMGVWAPRDFKYWKEPKGFTPEQGALEIPRGCLTRLLAYLKSTGLEVNTVENLVDKKAKLGISTVTLRDYQKVIVDRIVANLPSEGIIFSSTGSGKTVISLEIIHRMGLSATILVINSVIQDQFISEAKKFYNIDASIINGKSKDIGQLTISTFQSLYDAPELLQKLSDNTSVLIIDEVQSAPSKERAKVLAAFRPKHLYGLTATPERSDSLTKAIFFLSGHPIAEHQMEQAQPEVEVIRTEATIPMSDTYNDIIVSMVENKSRNTLITSLIAGELLNNRKVLVLTKRIAHYKLFEETFTEDGTFFIDSDDKDRNAVLSALKTELVDFNVIFGTTSLLAVGTDIPSLDTLILACDMKSSVLTTQSVGRILRLFEGKPTPRIIDLYDDQNPILASQFKSRLDLYKSKGWEIKHSFKCQKCKQIFTYYRKEYLIHNKQCMTRYGKPN